MITKEKRILLVSLLLEYKKHILQQDEIEVINKKTGSRYDVSKGYYKNHKLQYEIPKDNVDLHKDNDLPKKPSVKLKTKNIDKLITKIMPGGELPQVTTNKISEIDRREVSMKLNKLAQMGKQAREKGQKAPNFNLCKITIPGTNLYCGGNKNIPRQQMPQFKGIPIKGSPADNLPKAKNGHVDAQPFFRELLKKKNIKVSQSITVKPDRLKATQNQLLGVKVAGMSQILQDPNHPAYNKIINPIYVSKDGYVLDGHHRWAAIVSHNMMFPQHQIPLKVKVINEDIIPLVKLSNKFAKDIGIEAEAE